MLNLFQHLLPKAILTQILEILKEILKQVQDDKSVQDDSELNLDALALGLLQNILTPQLKSR